MATPQIEKPFTGVAVLDRWATKLVGLLNARWLLGTDRIQSVPVPAPTSADDGKVLAYDADANAFTYAAAGGGGGSVDDVTASSPLASSGGATPNITLASAVPVALGGTGATTASGARTSLGAAASGANSDITSLSGLTTPLSIGQGGTGATGAAGARTNLGLGTAATRDVPASGDASATEVVKGDDSRLTDSRTPTAHASTHASGGSDPVTIAESQVTGLVADLAAKVSGVTGTAPITSSGGTTPAIGVDLGAGGSLATSGGKLVRAALTGDVTASADANATTIAANAVTDAKLRQGAATSVIGRASGSTGNVADIAASADGQLLGRSGGALSFRSLVASDAATRVAVTGDTTIAATTPIVFVDVTTLSANLTITLSAAITGQIVIITDATGAAGSGSFIAKIAANGSETFAVRGGSAAGLYLSEDSGSITLEGVAGSGWRAVGGSGWGCDYRTISNLYTWLDARHGLTLASQRFVSAWNDFSGNGRHFAQATTTSQPFLARMPGTSALPAVFFDASAGARGMTCASQSMSSGAFTAFFLFATPPPATDGTYRTLWTHGYSGTTGFGVYLSAGAASGSLWNTYDSLAFGKGSSIGQTPMATGYWQASGAVPVVRGTAPHVLAVRLGASNSALYADGAPLIQRTLNNGACGSVSNQTIYLGCGQGGATEFSNAHLSAVVVFDAALSDANFALVQADLLRQAVGRGP